MDTDGQINWKGFLTYLKSNVESAQNVCRMLLSVSLSFIIPKEPYEWEYLQREFEVMKNIMDRRIPQGHQIVIDLNIPDDLLGQNSTTLSMTSMEFASVIKELGDSLTKGQQEGVEITCRKLLHKLKEDMNISYMVALERYHTFLLLFITYLNKYNILECVTNMDLRIDNIFGMDFPRDCDKIEQNFVNLSRIICIYMNEHCENENDLVIERVNKYIKDNLRGNLSLAKIAEKVHFNPSYLSRFYKQATGRNISEFINAEKFEKAKEFLTETQMKVNEIAIKLGFENVSYFILFFKKFSTLTPQEYRESK
jgi:two-component system response regulator YesN